MAKKPRPEFDTSVIPEHVAYFRNKETRPSYSWKDVAPEDHAFAFTVAKATQAEVLTEIKAALDDAIAKGETAEMFKAKLAPKLMALGWWGRKEQVDPVTGEVKTVQLGSLRRLETIFQTNTRIAYAAGAWERAQRTKHLLPFFAYRLGPSEVHRPEHERLEGLILPIDHDFWITRYPPTGFGCKCWTQQLSTKQAQAAGYDPEKPAPDFGTRKYYNSRDGETIELPRGVDPGFGVNPGRLRGRVLARHLAGRLDGAPPEIAKVVARDVVTSQHFQNIQTMRVQTGAAPVAMLPVALQQSLGTSTRTVLFSADTAKKQAGMRAETDPGNPSKGHPEVRTIDYAKVQSLLETGTVTRAGNHITLTGKVDGAFWRAVVKRTAKGDEVYLQSLSRGNANQNARKYTAG